MKLKRVLPFILGAMIAVTPATAFGVEANIVVGKGQTIEAIAARYGTTVQGIKDANKAYFDYLAAINPEVSLEAGVSLTLPIYVNVHTVAKGQTLESIASQYGTSVDAIKGLNKGYFDRLEAASSANPSTSYVDTGATVFTGVGATSIVIEVGAQLLVPSNFTPSPTTTYTGTNAAHVVTKGQSLASVARLYGVSEQAIRTLNDTYFKHLAILNIVNGTDVSLEAGVELVLPIYIVAHTVQPGQSLEAIASRYGTSVQVIKDLNASYFELLAISNVVNNTDVTVEAGVTLFAQTKTPPPVKAALSGDDIRTVTVAALNVKSAASPDAAVMGSLGINDTVWVLDVSNGWARIAYNGGIGYIDASYLK